MFYIIVVGLTNCVLLVLNREWAFVIVRINNLGVIEFVGEIFGVWFFF